MRAIRPFAAAVSVLMLAVVGTGVTTAEEPTVTEFQARATVDTVVEPGTFVFGDDLVEYRGVIETGVVIESSDPRFSGTYTWAANRDQHSDPGGFNLWNGTMRVENDEGAWQEEPNTWYRASGRQRPWPVTSVLRGEGAYDGWSVVAHVVEEGQTVFDGVIFEGEPPPAPEVPVPLAE